jgi:ATP-binding cassette subfamily B protein
LYELLGEPIDESFKTTSENSKFVSSEINNVIQVKNLTFSYPGKTNKVLDNISFAIKRGEKIGIAGASGCGKSTLIKILLRLVHDYSGEVILLGKDLKNISREEIAQKIAYVPQKNYIFSGTIKENIVYGCFRANVSEEEIVSAAKKANIYKEIIDSLGGLSGRVGENGNNLSGGQKQRLAIARLILKSPELFIFDEATSALDNTNEVLIQKSIEDLYKDKTMITIAHRLTTLKNTDKILVFGKGKIVQEGTFVELSNKKGLFQEFLNQKEDVSS